MSLYSLSNKIVGLVQDYFCVSMIDVGNEIGNPLLHVSNMKCWIFKSHSFPSKTLNRRCFK